MITDSYALMQHHAIEYAPVPYSTSRIAEAGKRRTDNEEKFNPNLSRRKEEEGVELGRAEDGRICSPQKNMSWSHFLFMDSRHGSADSTAEYSY